MINIHTSQYHYLHKKYLLLSALTTISQLQTLHNSSTSFSSHTSYLNTLLKPFFRRLYKLFSWQLPNCTISKQQKGTFLLSWFPPTPQGLLSKDNLVKALSLLIVYASSSSFYSSSLSKIVTSSLLSSTPLTIAYQWEY